MTNQEIVIQGDMIHGEINRICVTQELEELERMTLYAFANITELYRERRRAMLLKRYEEKRNEQLRVDGEIQSND